MSPINLSERCRMKDMRHVEILEDIENSTNEGYRLTAIRDLFDRGHGRPRQAIVGSGPGGAIPRPRDAPALELMIAGPEGGPSSDMQRYEG